MSETASPTFHYPTAFRQEDTNPKDPYRWMEDVESDRVKEWVTTQNKITAGYLDANPYQEQILASLKAGFQYPKTSVPYRRGKYWYWSHNTGSQNHSVTYQGATPYATDARVFLDPNTLSEDGTTSIRGKSFTRDGSLVKYTIQEKGSDWGTVRVMDTTTLEQTDDLVEWTKFSSGSFTNDNKGFFYCRYFETTGDGTETGEYKNHSIYYHRLGTPQSEDLMVYRDPANPSWSVGSQVSYDGRYLIVDIREGCKQESRLYIGDLTSGVTANMLLTPVYDNFETEWTPFYSEGDWLYMIVNQGTPLKKIVRVNMTTTEQQDLVAESKHPLTDACATANNFFLTYKVDVHDVVRVYDRKFTHLYDLDLPSFGSVGLSTHREDTSLHYTFSSYTYPTTVYRFDPEDRTSTQLVQSGPKGFNPDNYVVKQHFYPSKDGTRIPMYTICRKRSDGEESNGMMLYGYGGFNISIDPGFSSLLFPMIDHLDVDFAVANIRGGGEYGAEWHEAGRLNNKQNCFDDFQAAGEYLVSNGYATTDNLLIRGGSNGGLLVAACLNQRPDLFKGGIAQVGVLDMTRFHKFTIGHAWKSDYGDPDRPEDLKTLLKYSPYHNIPNKPYPATLVVTADHDDRVVPLHSYKFVARLQHLRGSESDQTEPLLALIHTDTGHGSGKGQEMVLRERAQMLTFVSQCLNTGWRET